MDEGLTVNERLFAAGLLAAFDEAAKKRDREAMIEILKRAGFESPEWTVDTLLQDPRRYGS